MIGPQGHVSALPFNGLNEGDIIIRRNSVKLLLDKYASICESEYQSKPFKEYEFGESSKERGIWRELLIMIGLENELKAIEIGTSF